MCVVSRFAYSAQRFRVEFTASAVAQLAQPYITPRECWEFRSADNVHRYVVVTILRSLPKCSYTTTDT